MIHKSVAENNSHRVLSLAKQRGDIIFIIAKHLIRVRNIGSEKSFCDVFAVDIKLVKSGCRNKYFGSLGRKIKLEVFSYHRSGN